MTNARSRPSLLARLRHNGAPVARLTLAAMLLPLWLSMMAALSPSAADLLGAGPDGSLCLSAPADGAGKTQPAPVPGICIACHIPGCGMMTPLAPAGSIAHFLTDAPGPVIADARAVSRPDTAPPPANRPRAPPLA